MRTVQKKPLLGAKSICSFSLAAALVAGSMLAGCAGTPAANTNANVGQPTTTASSVVKDVNLEAFDLEFTNRDKDASYDESSAVKIELTGNSATVEGQAAGVSVSGSTVTISKEGVYVLAGTLDDGQVVVDCNEEDKAKVQLVLGGVNITNADGPAIQVNQAKKCFITLKDGTANVLSDGESYTLEQDSDEPYSAIYSKDDLTIQGNGSLTVNANYRHGIVSKDDLVVTGGNITVNAKEDALRGRDCVKVCGGVFNLTSGEDAVKSNNDEAADAGYVYLAGGTFVISAGDDGIHAETALIIDDGKIDIQKSYEGLEGQQIYVNGGDVNVVASDDGVNAAVGSNSDAQSMGMADRGQNHKFEIPEGAQPSREAPQPGQVAPGTPENPGGMGPGSTSAGESAKMLLKITGGTLAVDAGGDGLDSNGSLEISGGTVIVNGPTSSGDGALDYDGSATITGGTVIAVGSAGMAEGFTGGTQPFAMANVNGNAGSKVEVKDANGKVIASMTATKQFSSVVVSAPGFTSGAECSVVVDGQSVAITPSTDAVANQGVQGFGGHGMGGMKERQRPA